MVLAARAHHEQSTRSATTAGNCLWARRRSLRQLRRCGPAGSPAQDPTTLLGKLVRLDVDTPGAEPEIRALGLRNPWRFSFDQATGDVYIGDVGQDRREEVDRLPRAFHGLAKLRLARLGGIGSYSPVPADLPGRVLPPFVEYRHAKGRCTMQVTGGYVYRGSRLKRVNGRYVYGDLCGGRLERDRPRRRGARQARRAASHPPGLLVSFAEGWRGELYIVALTGGIYEVSPPVAGS
jgi:hypothetical protein